MTNEMPIPFEEYECRGNFFIPKEKRYTPELHQAYIKISSYILKNENINLAKVKNPQTILTLAQKFKADKNFMADTPSQKELCLQVLDRYYSYLKNTI